eukprot:1351032-Rhodomonas_salina.2
MMTVHVQAERVPCFIWLCHDHREEKGWPSLFDRLLQSVTAQPKPGSPCKLQVGSQLTVEDLSAERAGWVQTAQSETASG